MAANFRWLLGLVALVALCLGVQADCVSYGVDYSNGGAYYIDGSSNQYFSFITVFQGCTTESISPILTDPDGNQYACSAINTTPAGAQITSTCGIPFSAMKSGVWKIVVSGDQIAVQRSITLTVGIPQTVTVIATPTIVLGITSTPKAKTAITTIFQTQTLILVPGTVTGVCNGVTQTVTNYVPVATQTITSTIVRTSTDGAKTSQWTTTLTSSASCHYPSKKRDLAERDADGMQSVMATTVTYTETTLTVTQTRVTTVAPATTTEAIFRTVTATVTPSPTTVCAGGGNSRGVTVTVNRGTGGVITQTNVIYSTTHLSGTVWVIQTTYSTISNAASATACWRAGGWFGA